MPKTDRHKPAGSLWIRRLLLASLVAAAAAMVGCDHAEDGVESAKMPTTVGTPALARQLAVARVDAAKSRIANHRQDEALALLVSALHADPGFDEAESLAHLLLAGTVWNFPLATLNHQLPVEQLAFDPPTSLWVALAENTADGFNTTVRWDTQALKIESVLFPARGVATRGLIVGNQQHSVILQRGAGSAAVTLLCDAQSLRPIRDLGPLPEFPTAQTVVATSANGLLIAHPGSASATDKRLVWRIRDAATGEIIRSSEPAADDDPSPLAAHLDSRKLLVIEAGGGLLEIPVSPVEPVRRHAPVQPLPLLGARFSEDGGTVLGLLDEGVASAPVRTSYHLTDGAADGSLKLEPDTTPVAARAFFAAWSRHPTIWNGLLRDHGNARDPSPIIVDEECLRFCTDPVAPIRTGSEISAVAFAVDQVVTGCDDGTVCIHRSLPLPTPVAPPQTAGKTDPVAVGRIAGILSGIRFDEASGKFVHLTAGERLELLDGVERGAAGAVVADLDFSAALVSIDSLPPRVAPAGAMLPVWMRLADSDPGGGTWPHLLDLAQSFGDSRWHQDLAEAVAMRGTTRAAGRADDPSPWLAQSRIREVFATGDSAAVLGGIQDAGGKGPAAATALALALESDSPEWIDACLRSARDLPPLLRVLGESRIAWLQQRIADAITLWPDEFPDYQNVRLTEDWDGWEQADYSPCYAAQLDAMNTELARYQLAPDATGEERADLAKRLLDPATRGIIGRRRLAENCLKTALVLVDFPDLSTATCQLANRARSLGAQAEPCLRAEALSLTRLGDYKAARERWVTLLTEYPVANHESGDYAEAAYTAFENSDPNQAVEILTTGIKRFPADSGFALRAGWIALLGTHYEDSYQFLLAGLRTGFADDKLENANLLLAVAAQLAGFPDDAAIHYQNLLEIEPAWADAETIDALEWPEELKQTLHGLVR